MIESIAGAKKFRISPQNHTIVQIQRGYHTRWLDYAKANSLAEASALVLELARWPEDETQEMEACHQ